MSKSQWFTFIGLEIHAQILSESKLFSNARNCVDGGECGPNACLDLLDYALPGVLPVLNKYCVQQAIKTALGINANLNMISRFDRKNYFYPDLPAGYQITQHYTPLAENGYLYINGQAGADLHRVNIRSMHMEQDAGKLLHNYGGKNLSAVDLNRAGVPLMEIVTDPNMHSAEDAASFVKLLRSILRYLGTCDGDMQNGSLRIDANVSVSQDSQIPGVRAEIKNLNSIKFLKQAIEYEVKRQIDALSAGQKLKQQTRLFDENTGKTHAMRDKEDKYGYRYFADPDLPPLCLDQSWVDEIRASLPELPPNKSQRLEKQYGLTEDVSNNLIQDRFLADFFETSAREVPQNPRLVANWLLSVALGVLHKNNLSCEDVMNRASQFGVLINLLDKQKLTNTAAKQVLDVLLLQGGNVEEIIKDKNLLSLNSEDDIKKLVQQVISREPKNWQNLLQGQEKLKKWFVGQVMYLTRGRANPEMVENIIGEIIDRESNNSDN